MINPGSLNKRIKILSDTGDEIDEDGYPIPGGQTIKEVWSEVRSLRGREIYQASSFQAQINKVFVFRYFEGLEHNMYIKYRNQKYNIESIDNINEIDRFYKVYARLVKSSE